MHEQSPASNRRLITRLVLGVFAAAMVARAGESVRAYYYRDEESFAAAAVHRAPRVERVLIISVDGLRPDVLLRARAPNIRSLMARGAFSMWARTTELSNTLPSHTSMLTGVRPEHHRITWNYYIPDAYPDAATIFERAHEASAKRGGTRLTTGLVAGKSKFYELARPGSVDFSDVFDSDASNVEVGEAAVYMIRRHAPRVMFVHLPDVDVVGHTYGWGTASQLEAVDRADEAVGLILRALAERNLTATTFIILSADHGGQGWSHGPNDPRSRHIPWIAAGPGVLRNYDLTRFSSLVINTEDTFATACAMMDIPVPDEIDGRFVREIRYNDDLMRESKPPPKKDTRAYDLWWDPPDYEWEPAPMPTHHP
jgi:hypothetical protein